LQHSVVAWAAQAIETLLSEIANFLEDYGLKPTDPPVVQDFDSVVQILEALPKPPPTEFDAQWNAALLNTPVVDMADVPDNEIDLSESDDHEDWQGQPGRDPPTS
jgi:hypothetical protein